ncbi:hypothetical protein BLNAU_2964 [Blattamonas nauphoetae]|uniref:Uncharacterized protein n=1 Tax=Blattamonas nauphoetae TaxID=2049346 RepID=A0ABQ9YDQ9_9EUKA|nr:hypothetical protein BLNAU_2964 [Blattamonas nauphoetae]
MPPKHKLGRKRSETQSNTWIQHLHSSKSNANIIDSTIQDSIGDGNRSLDTHSIPFTTDVLTITANDRHYFRVSKQILQYELKRKRMNVEPMLEQAHLEGDAISLPTSTTSDWRLVLQDSITTDALRQGCLSLFEQANSGLNLASNEVVHAVRFLQYATIHIKHRKYPHNELLETIFPEEEYCPAKLMSALIKLVCHPSDKLRAATLSFFAVGISNSTKRFSLAVAATGLLPQLFKCLKTHEIPLHGTTIDFHLQITSIVDKFFNCSPEEILDHLDIIPTSSLHEIVASDPLDPIFQPFYKYLRHLIASPAYPPDCPSGISLLSKMKIYTKNIKHFKSVSSHPDLEPIFYELRKNLTKELASLLDFTPTKWTLHPLLFGERKRSDELRWTETFERILDRLNEGTQFSDLGLESFRCFLSNRPRKVKMIFQSDGTFSIEADDRIVSSMERPTNSLCALLTPTRPDHAASILAHIRSFTTHHSSAALLRDITSGWFSDIFAALTPSKLPFTSEFRSLHTQLIELMNHTLSEMLLISDWNVNHRSRSDLNPTYLSFLNQTRDYIVHLSLHPFALDRRDIANPILDFLTRLIQPDFENSLTMPIRERLRKDMDDTALSSSSPPFILTSELVCDLTDEEVMNVVDRIVALLESDSPIDDDTILRICAFHSNQLKSVYLPELFRQAGRSTEQCFHAFNSLLSLPTDSFQLSPIKCLLNQKPPTLQPTFDEWDDVDLATVGVVLPTIDEKRLSFNSASLQLLQFAGDVLPELLYCAYRLTPSQLERLLTPSIGILFNFFIQQLPSNHNFIKDRAKVFAKLSRLSEQRVIAKCLSRIGFFSRMVCGLLDDDLFFEYQYGLRIFLNQPRYSSDERPEWKTVQRSVHHFLEEGWQDVLDLLFVRKNDTTLAIHRIKHAKDMMQFLGANFNCQIE